MNPLREKTPCRSKDIKVKSCYRDYKEELQKDFNARCGYCDDHDTWKKADYHIDHFVPKKQLTTIKENDYSNLVYSCCYCNRNKWNDWPTQNEKIHHNGRVGYIDPCDPEYDKQFYRDNLGQIIPKTELGKYMRKKLKLHLYRHSVIYRINKLDRNIDEIEALDDKHESLFELYREFRKMVKELNCTNE